jgi:hypothetical protein
MEIDDIVALAERVHDAEGINLGASSTREYRNAFWARVIGIVHHGHREYNRAPDPRWHIKSAGGGRPQSDDVVVLMPSREYWDCIPSAGADGYSFRATYHGALEAGQDVYAPPVPSGPAPVPVPPSPPVEPPAPPAPPAPVPPPVDTELHNRIALVQTGLSFLINQIAAQRNDIEVLHRQQANLYDLVSHVRLEMKEARAAMDRPLTVEIPHRLLGTLRGTIKP